MMLISTLQPFFLGRYNRVTSLWLYMAWYCCNIFRVSLSIISNFAMVQSSTRNPYDSAVMTYKLTVSKVCLLKSSLFRIVFNHLKSSFLKADLVVLLVVKLQILSICIVGLIPVILVLHHYWAGCFPYQQFFHVELWVFYICQSRSSFQYHHWIYWQFLSFTQIDCHLQERV